MTEQFIGQLGYFGIALALILGGLGLPIPEEAPIILAAMLSRNGSMAWPIAFLTCVLGVLLGDFVVYFLGYYHGERVLSLPLTRRLLTRAREAQIKGYFHRHGFKILVLGRFAVGFRTAAYLTAGILKLPPLKLLLTDLLAAVLSTTAMFGLGYVFADQIKSGMQELQRGVTVVIGVSVAVWLLYRHHRARQRSGLPVGPPVLVCDLPLPPDDLRTHPDGSEGMPRAVAESPPTGTQAPGPTSHGTGSQNASTQGTRAQQLQEVTIPVRTEVPRTTQALEMDSARPRTTWDSRSC